MLRLPCKVPVDNNPKVFRAFGWLNGLMRESQGRTFCLALAVREVNQCKFRVLERGTVS